VVAVPPAYTSQTCSACQVADGESRITRGLFVCRHCGHVEHADVNAGKVILHRAMELLSTGGGPSLAACGALCASMATKQEGPAEMPGSPAL
jgi:putative transposase